VDHPVDLEADLGRLRRRPRAIRFANGLVSRSTVDSLARMIATYETRH
jgi:hypothetical protein